MLDSYLPIRLAPHEDESGLGYCLRLAHANGGAFSSLRRALGMAERESFKQWHAPAMARLAGLDASVLRAILPASIGRGGGTRLSCYGSRFRSRSALRLRRPQLCPVCVRTQRYAKAEWDLSLSTVCLQHHCDLIDRCPRCRAAIRWERSAIEWGHCGHSLGGSMQGAQVEEENRLAQAILSARLAHQSVEALLDSAGLFPWLAKLSVDGWMHLIRAVGLLMDRCAVPARGTFGMVPTADSAREVVGRGMWRLVAWSQSSLASRELADFSTEVPMIGMILEPSGECDREIFLRVFSCLYGRKALNQLERSRVGLSQMRLFEGSE